MGFLILNMLFGPYCLFFLGSGKVIIHALDEKARAYYNLEGLWTGPDTLPKEPIEVNLRLT